MRWLADNSQGSGVTNATLGPGGSGVVAVEANSSFLNVGHGGKEDNRHSRDDLESGLYCA
jgi:hypothetical protein